MEVFVQQLINGLTLGSIYGLIAIGYTMVFGIIGMINFAHGDVFMVSAFIALILFLILTTLARHRLRVRGPDDRHGAGDDPDRPVGLDAGARRLPAAARLLPAGAAHLRHRRVDLPRQPGAGRARRAQQADAADGAGGDPAVRAQRLSGDPVLQAGHHHDRHRLAPRPSSGTSCRRRRSGARSAPASRTARWPPSSASTSTAPSR